MLILQISEKGMQPSENKITAIFEAEEPENLKAVRSFLGLTNYLKRSKIRKQCEASYD